jgi:hypothetical protein
MNSGIDERIRQLERASDELRQALQVPGVEGQTRLFAKLEDVHGAMEEVRRAIGSASVGPEDRRRALGAIEACREQLSQAEKAFAVVARMLAEGESDCGEVGYGCEVQGAGFRVRAGVSGAMQWEG